MRDACAVRCVALQQCQHGRQQEREEHAVRLGHVERMLQGGFGGGPVAELVLGGRLQRICRNQPGPHDGRNGAAQHRGELGERGSWVAFGKPQRRGGDADLRMVAILSAEPVQDLPGMSELAKTYQGLDLPCAYPRKNVLR